MNMRKTLFALILVTVVSLPSFGEFPSRNQTTWHGGISATTYQQYFDPYFLEETGTAWQSAGQLSLEYPILNESIYSDISFGSQGEPADITGDGYPDLVIVSSSASSDVVLLENPGATYIPVDEWNSVVIAPSFASCQSVSSEDIDGDGDIDVIVGCYGSTGIVWLENPGTSGIWLLHAVGDITGVTSVDCGDMDMDGDPDILFCSALKDTLGWMNNLDGFGGDWGCEVVSTSNYPFKATVTDVNSDGVPDVSACYRIEGSIRWFKRDATDNTWTEFAVAEVPQVFGLSAGDYNGDSFIDILACGLEENSAFLCTSIDGSGTSWSTTNLELDLTGSKSCLLLDLEDDGDLDIAVSAQTQDSVIILSNMDGLGENWFKTSLVVEKPLHLQPIDTDMDGLLEIACLCRDEVRILSSSPASFTTAGNLTSVVTSVVCYTDNEWGNLLWDSWEPPGTSISFQVRNSDDPYNMGEWSDTISTNGTFLGDLFPEICYYIQYRAILNSDSPDTSPFLYSVDIEGYIGDVYDYSEAVADVPLISVNDNPSLESIAVTLSPFSQGIRELMIYDVSGRLVERRSYEPENSSVMDTIEGLSPGVYHIVATAGHERETLKICIIR
ncbi:MAG: T9SS type A sorting domain-containing protein [Candidatus Sabulitectum sp.]|nr:T9SS type A sorting domain-containing protein [Candidatus Sabulitectum sp.]